jgi:hypothetical protein
MRLRFDTHELVQQHPPHLLHEGKQVVYETACPPGTVHGGELSYSRWSAMVLRESVDPSGAEERVHIRPTIYDYVNPNEDAVHWYVNFADARLFFGCGTSLLAQDELQVAEHPALASLMQALSSRGDASLTVENGKPTPILVMGAERRCLVATDVNPDEGRPYGLYGSLFGVAPSEVVRRATRRIDPPTLSNIIAIAAPPGGEGAYAEHEIERILATAYTGFRAAVLETQTQCGHSRAIIHTGWWGCGVFGGNKVLMAMLQIVAAHMADVNSLQFYSVTDRQMDAVEYALARLREIGEEGALATKEFIGRMVALELRWGVGDGN